MKRLGERAPLLINEMKARVSKEFADGRLPKEGLDEICNLLSEVEQTIEKWGVDGESSKSRKRDRFGDRKIRSESKEVSRQSKWT